VIFKLAPPHRAPCAAGAVPLVRPRRGVPRQFCPSLRFDCLSPIALRVPLHYPRAAPDHEPGSGLLGDGGREHGAGQFGRAANRQRLVVLPFGVPFFDVEVKGLFIALLQAA
jgi:hypothetical protein